MKKTFVGIVSTLVLLGGLSFGLTSCLNSDNEESDIEKLNKKRTRMFLAHRIDFLPASMIKNLKSSHAQSRALSNR